MLPAFSFNRKGWAEKGPEARCAAARGKQEKNLGISRWENPSIPLEIPETSRILVFSIQKLKKAPRAIE
jgi:hypothetical protein